MNKFLIIFVTWLTLAPSLWSQQRIKDIASIKGVEDRRLIGYGLIVGLDGTGDGRKSLFTVQAVTNMLSRLGITVPAEDIRLKNVASVIVTATVPGFSTRGMQVDVTVSSLGDASSLEGGLLLMTPLEGIDGNVYAHAQGPVSLGGFNVQTDAGERVRKNYTLVGRVPNGAQLVRDVHSTILQGNTIGIALRDPDFTSVSRMVEAINSNFGSEIASAKNAGEVAVQLPSDFQSADKQIGFIAELEGLQIETDRTARIVINERTGTVVVGEHVKVRPVAIAHGNLNIEIRSNPIVSQPGAFSGGQTVVVPQTNTTVTSEDSRLMVIENAANVKDVAAALNTLGVTPRDLIAIFQALKRADAINAELIIM
ncbi:flagellar basal body P-ring protein FlgI [candidate division KSB1 bacterium]|nr:flagellar basal body P-ring protein FlgI [candidate division KSB1 bacterium]